MISNNNYTRTQTRTHTTDEFGVNWWQAPTAFTPVRFTYMSNWNPVESRQTAHTHVRAHTHTYTPHTRTGLDWTGLDWTGLDWTGLDWTGLDWTGLDWTGLDWTGLDWTGLDWTGLDWTGLDWTGQKHTQLSYKLKKIV